jgi:gamma-glutamyltranspeptidase/glutathione hydrolase
VLDALSTRTPVAVADQRDPYFGGVSAMSPLGGGADPRRSGAVALL